MFNQLLFILLYSYFYQTSGNTNVSSLVVTSIDEFPHHINEDFNIHLSHPKIEIHHKYAVIIAQLKCKDVQKIYLYPGFSPTLNQIMKEKYFHVTKLIHKSFNTRITLRFFRSSQNCSFELIYSKSGGKDLFSKKKFEKSVVLVRTVFLYRKPIMNLEIVSQYGQRSGVSLNVEATIICSSRDSYPIKPVEVSYRKGLNVNDKINMGDEKTKIVFTPTLEDHLTYVTCQSYGVISRRQIIVYHHSQSVEIIPTNTRFFKPGAKLECKEVGSSYPAANITWTVSKLSVTTKPYFIFNSSDSLTSKYFILDPSIPYNSKWEIKCSSFNIIPPMDLGGPFKILNITIGEDVEMAKRARTRIWTLSFISVLVVIIFIFGLVCIVSRVRCNRKRHCWKPNKSNKDSKRQTPETTQSLQIPLQSSQEIDNPNSALLKAKQPTAPSVLSIQNCHTPTNDGDQVKFYCEKETEFFV